MKLTEDQQQTVRQWVAEGKSLADLQKLLQTEFNLLFTYMDVRFLVDDLALELKDTRPKSPQKDLEKSGSDLDESFGSEDDEDSDPDYIDAEPVGGGSVSVSLDKITRPGSVVSGRVTFSDGVNAQWTLDQMGRLGLAGTVAGYRPPQDDLMQFQQQLQQLLEGRAM